MKKLFLYVFLVLMFCNIAEAETYNCTYKSPSDNETYQAFYVRDGNSFIQIFGGIKTKYKIVEENSEYIVLIRTYPRWAATTFISKKNKSFSSIGLGHLIESTRLSQGNCKITKDQ